MRKISRKIVLFPRRLVTLTPLLLPTRDRKELRKMIDVQMTQYLPYKREDIIFDYIIRDHPQTHQTDLLLVTARQDDVLEFLESLQDQHIKPEILTLSSLAIADWFMARNPVYKETLLIYMDAFLSELCFLKNQTFQFSREIPSDKKGNTEWIFHYIEITRKQYQRLHRQSRIERIALVSDEDMPSLRSKLSSAYGISVDIFSAPEYQNSLLELEHGKQKCPSINLLPDAVKKQRMRTKRRCYWMIMTLLTTGVFLAGFIFFRGSLRRYHEQVNDLQRSWKLLKPKVQRIQEYQHRLNFLKKEIPQQPFMVDILYQLKRLLPRGVTLDTFRLTDRQFITIEAEALSGDKVNQLYARLAAHPLFDRVKLQYTKRQRKARKQIIRFKMTFSVKGS